MHSKPNDIKQHNEAVTKLTTVLQTTIKENVRTMKPRPDSKRWQNTELNSMKQKLNKLKVESFKCQAITNYPSQKIQRNNNQIKKGHTGVTTWKK